jgi:uncharacterized protein
MPVRSLRSSVIKWPSRDQVTVATKTWAAKTRAEHQEVRRIGYFGSYARGDWGVGSDLDIVIVIDRSELPFERRSTEFDAREIPVPVDLLVYTEAEMEEWDSSNRKFAQTIAHEMVWL